MEILTIAQWVVASTVSLYWFCVAVMVIRSRRKFRVASGALPKTKFEKKMWMIWAPTIVAWIALAWSSDNAVASILPTGSLASSIWITTTVLAATLCVLSYFFTTRCWMKMGQDWSMAVEPDKETKLITDGPFSSVRHPIYALSLALMISSVFVVTNVPMLIVAAIHCSLLVIKSWNEERYLTQLHGQEYVDYLNRTNRFVPIRAIFG